MCNGYPRAAGCLLGKHYPRRVQMLAPGGRSWLTLYQSGPSCPHPSRARPAFSARFLQSLSGRFFFVGGKACLGCIRLRCCWQPRMSLRLLSGPKHRQLPVHVLLQETAENRSMTNIVWIDSKSQANIASRETNISAKTSRKLCTTSLQQCKIKYIGQKRFMKSEIPPSYQIYTGKSRLHF